MNNIQIITVTTDDQWEQLRALSRDLQLFEQSIRPERKEFSDISRGSFLYLQRNVAENQGIALLAINESHETVGFMTAWVEDSDGLDQGHPQVALISDAYIKPGYRNSYTFKKMGLMTAAHFKNLGLDRLHFYTLAANTRMQDLFSAMGFKPFEVVFEIPLDKLLD